jgi:hypothetical protein
VLDFLVTSWLLELPAVGKGERLQYSLVESVWFVDLEVEIHSSVMSRTKFQDVEFECNGARLSGELEQNLDIEVVRRRWLA